jgi:TonB family protein
MWSHILLLSLIVTTFLVLSGNRQERSASGSDTHPAEVILTKLNDPVYPSSASAATIHGDVELTLRIKGNGTIESVDVASGPPMLRQAAIKSVQAPHFECRRCDRTLQSYSLTYEFRIIATTPEQYCKTYEERLPPKVDSSLHKVTVFAKQFWTCDLAVEVKRRRIRSTKCLYLWKCGVGDVVP